MATRRFVRRSAAAAVAVTVLALLSACGSDAPVPLRVGSDDTSAMRVAAQIYGQALARTGLPIDVVARKAGEKRLLDDAAQGELDLFPAFTGDLLSELTPEREAVGGEEVAAAVSRALPQGVTIGDPAAVSDRRQLVLAQSLAASAGVTDLADCAKLPPGLPLVTTGELSNSDRQAFDRCRIGPILADRTPAQVIDAVRDGRAVGSLTGLESATALTGHDDLLSLRSAASGPIAQELVPVFRSAVVGKPQMKALSRVAGELTTADLAELAARVDGGADPAAVAGGWLGTHGV